MCDLSYRPNIGWLGRAWAAAFVLGVAVAFTGSTAAAQVPAFRNEALSFEERARDLVSRLTLEEKVQQMKNAAPAIERLQIPAYEWWNEALHGVARSGLATVFPQAIGMAATWDDSLMFRMATVISDEGRAKYHEYIRNNSHARYQGLTFWSPNINIFRDPRWGRGQETYGEDPFLTGQLGVEFIRGLQGDDPTYYKTVATVKHFAVHSGPEPARHEFDAVVNERDLRETYLPHFERGIREGKAYSLMCAYNRVGGLAACASDPLLKDILRDEWKFPGFIVSDCGAIDDIHLRHKLAPSAAAASAMAVKSGTDLDCGRVYPNLVAGVAQGLITEAQIDVSLQRLFLARFKLGMFDAPERVRWAQTPYRILDQPSHKALALTAARKSIVLLKNTGNALPLSKTLGTIAVIGPNADVTEMLLGNYNGTPSDPVTPLRGIRAAVGPNTRVLYARGSWLVDGFRGGDTTKTSDELLAEAVSTAQQADAIVMVLGLTARLEGEEMRVDVDGFEGGDRTTLDLPASQQRVLERVSALGKPVTLVLMNGSALSVHWAQQNVPAILEAWYPGQAGGTAIADVLFGDYNPGGRLPVTFYERVGDLPPFEDYAMAGRTYRYFKGAPLYAFGHGLSYTTFRYADLRVSAPSMRTDGNVTVSVAVTNTGTRSGDEVVQLYARHVRSAVTRPNRDLRGYARITLEPGETRVLSFTVEASSLAWWNAPVRRWEVEAAPIEFEVGASSADIRLRQTINVTR